MLRYRLRYQDSEVPLHEGEFVIGRGHASHLLLDDPRVSRRHAIIRVRGTVLTLEDPGSHGGVMLNGTFVRNATSIAPGDRIQIGPHEITLVWRSPMEESATQENIQRIPWPTDEPDASTAPSELLFDLAESSIAEGNVEEADWIVGKILAELHYRMSSAGTVSALGMERGATACIRVAALTGKTAWLDGLFDVLKAAAFALPSSLIDELEPLVGRAKYPDAHRLESYVKALQERAGSMTAEQTERLGRLEWLLETR